MLAERAPGFTALSLLLPCVLLCLQAGCKNNQPTTAALQRFQGYWDGGGAGGIKCSIAITGNALHFYSRTDFWYETTFTLPAGTDPQQLRATIKDCAPPTNSVGQLVVAIFKIEDGTLTLAVNQDPQGPPPKAFPSDPNGLIARYDLKKVRKKNTQPPKTRVETQNKNGEASSFVKHPAEISRIASGPELAFEPEIEGIAERPPPGEAAVE